jgi:hypothetical protein
MPKAKEKGALYLGPYVDPVKRRQLKNFIRTELGGSKLEWKGNGTPIDRYEDPVSAAHKEEVQNNGQRFGCHTCCTNISVDTDQPWVGDHIPPTKLAPKVKKLLGFQTESTILYPQCDGCATAQAVLVNKLNAKDGGELSDAIKKLTPHERNLLVGGKPPDHYSIPSTGPKVSPAEGEQIQNNGGKYGCHSCVTPWTNFYPATKYHADHMPPVFFHKPGVRELMRNIGMTPPKPYEARPQCPRCSHEQGGNMANIDYKAKNLMRELGIKLYF